VLCVQLTNARLSKAKALSFARAFSRHITCYLHRTPWSKDKNKLYSVVRPYEEAPVSKTDKVKKIPDQKLEKVTITK
jgi:hypothetical protein